MGKKTKNAAETNENTTNTETASMETTTANENTATTATNGTTETAVKTVESKSDKFRRLASRRVNKALGVLRAIANLGNKNQYEYTQEQYSKVIGALEGQIEEIKMKFSGEKTKKQGFTL